MPPDGFMGDAAAPQQARLRGFASALLREAGALVEAIEPDGLEVLAPPPVQQALGVGELCRLGFGASLPPGSSRVGIEGEWLDRFARVLGEQGRWSRHVLADENRAPGDPERVLGRELVLDNATFRLLELRPAWTRYQILDFRASAVSDDKRDFMLSVGVNLATGALPDGVLAALAPEELDGAAGEAPEEAELPPLWDRARLLGLVERALTPRLETALAPFFIGLRRRLGRDQDRLHGYHDELHREAMARAQALPEADPRREREAQRCAAIGREYRAKLEDLARQYATRVTVQWVRTLELVMPVHRFTVQIRRRKADRTIQLDWNPRARRLEPPSCDWRASTERPSLVCDDALHLVVPAGLAPCPSCARPFCRACHPAACPKCNLGVADAGGMSAQARM